ncbi:M10 family metallopeptidase [Mycoplana dimorpha]|uniref:Serralysin n=1 Tax=Mycoplana dimorpha TaxID=28320 RepID=A0A2T5B7Q8_MYCDI|nr:M10 family metallopeptidase [Mycoplana dimorpha]PTM95015.1 serralysin [Mycoplana dimorpha]
MTGIGKTTKTITASGSDLVDSVLGEEAWSGSVTYAFPTSSSQYDYPQHSEPDEGFRTVSDKVKQAALFAMEQSYGSSANDGFSVEGFTNIALSQASSPATANIRLAESTYQNPTAKTFFPGQYAEAGDLWLGSDLAGTANDLRNPVAGNYAWHTVIHELGHAFGLNHAHDGEGLATMPSQYDSLEYTVMTYHTFVGDTGGRYTYGPNDAPQTFMMADIAALQRMYGADYTTNAGDTTYKWTPDSGTTYVNGVAAIAPGANRIFATIWDGGGTDTYDLSAYKKSVSIDLAPGKHSAFSDVQLAYLGGGDNDGFARGNIFNALLHDGDTRSLIENAKGGSGSDTIYGNEAGNKLFGNAGNDKLYGLSGNDSLFGGAGNDSLYGGSGNDILHGGPGGDRFDGGTGADTVSYASAAKGVTASLAAPSINTNDAAGDAYSSVENLAGTSYSDRLTGNSGANRLSGGAGNDVLDGGKGNDTLGGGSGADHFVFGPGYGKDVITDFTDGSDRVDLRSYHFTSVASVLNKADQVGDDVQFKFAATDMLVLKEFDIANLDRGDFLLA